MYDDRITKTMSRTAHISLTCVNHPRMRWNTKNIGGIGARSIRFDGERQDDGSFKPGTMYGGNPVTMLRNALNGKNYFDDSLESPNGLGITTWEGVLDFVAGVAHDMEKYSFECSCPASDLVVAPECLEGPEIEG